jgi:hypothetical protein
LQASGKSAATRHLLRREVTAAAEAGSARLPRTGRIGGIAQAALLFV